MDFKTGISPLTHKSIVEHNNMCVGNIDHLVEIINGNCDSVMSHVRCSNKDMKLIVLCVVKTITLLADERRELSKIGQ